MLPKITSALDAAERREKRAHHRRSRRACLLLKILTDEGVGTLIRVVVRSHAARLAARSDDTLHDTSPHVFPRIDRAITDYVSRRCDVSSRRPARCRCTTGTVTARRCSAWCGTDGVDSAELLREAHPLPTYTASSRATTDCATRCAAPVRKIVVADDSPHAYAGGVVAIARHRAADRRPGLDRVDALRWPTSCPSRRAAMLPLRRPAAHARRALRARRGLGAEPARDAHACRVRTILVTGLATVCAVPHRPRAEAGDASTFKYGSLALAAHRRPLR